MSGMNGLDVAVDLALSRRDAAAQVLANARQAWVAAQVQQDQLESYAQECVTRWSQRATGCTPDLMRHHYQFMERLHHAIALQSGIIADQERNVQREAVKLREAEGRLESLRQLLSVRQREMQVALGRREQKQSDEMAALQHRRRLEGHAGGLQ